MAEDAGCYCIFHWQWIYDVVSFNIHKWSTQFCCLLWDLCARITSSCDVSMMPLFVIVQIILLVSCLSSYWPRCSWYVFWKCILTRGLSDYFSVCVWVYLLVCVWGQAQPAFFLYCASPLWLAGGQPSWLGAGADWPVAYGGLFPSRWPGHTLLLQDTTPEII